MISMILWILAGVVIILIACFGFQYIFNRNFPLGVEFFSIIVCMVLIAGGFILAFMPWILQSSQEETLNMKTCKHIGGSYEVIDQVWNGKYYSNVYGCIKK